MFFNRVWEKKKDSEAAYAEHLVTLSDTLPRRKHDPLPAVPPSPLSIKEERSHSFSDRPYESMRFGALTAHSSSGSLVTSKPRLEVSVVDDDEPSPYAMVVKRPSLPSGTPLPPYTSTPNASSVEEVDPYASSTPLKKEIKEHRDRHSLDLQALYSKVDKSMIRRAATDEENEFGHQGAQRDSEVFVDSDTEHAPPVPKRTINPLEDDEYFDRNDEHKDVDPGYATVRSSSLGNNHDEGYSTVDETLQRGTKVCLSVQYL